MKPVTIHPDVYQDSPPKPDLNLAVRRHTYLLQNGVHPDGIHVTIFTRGRDRCCGEHGGGGVCRGGGGSYGGCASDEI